MNIRTSTPCRECLRPVQDQRSTFDFGCLACKAIVQASLYPGTVGLLLVGVHLSGICYMQKT